MITRFANPARFMRISVVILPWCSSGSVAVIAIGLYMALITAPLDYQLRICMEADGVDAPPTVFCAKVVVVEDHEERRGVRP